MITSAGAVLEINVSAIVANYRRLRGQAGVCNVAAVVKSDAYGLGAEEVAKQLLSNGCDTFFVAHLEEGINLRHSVGPVPKIFVLNGVPDRFEEAFLQYELTPVLNSLADISLWRKLAQRSNTRLNAALQVDSGMSRLGLSDKNVHSIRDEPLMLDGIKTELVMSHLACAGDPSHPANEQQRRMFNELSNLLPAARLSLANSSGIFLGDAYHYDLVRPGAALYGINPADHRENPMEPVVRLQARVLEIRHTTSGTSVGYDYSLVTTAPRRLATLSIGYADGWHRMWNVGAVYKGINLPLAGRISMDSLVVDITEVPETRLSRNMFVDLINSDRTLDNVATDADTIGYEILTSIGNRVERRYINGGGDAR